MFACCMSKEESVAKRRDTDPFKIAVDYISVMEVLQTLSYPMQLFIVF